jgi:esterase
MKLHFRAFGHGPPLIILHGLLGSLDNWVPVAQKLAAHSHVHLLDLRNHGHSPHAPEFDYDVMAEDVRHFLNDHGIAMTHLLGHSMGAKVAMRFAQLHSGAVKKLVVVDMSPREYPPRFDTLLDAMHALDVGGFRRREEVGVFLQETVPDRTVRQFLLKNLGRDGAGRLFWKPNLAFIRANYANLRGALPLTPGFDGPTLFVRGELSDYVRDVDLPAIKNLFPHAVVETISGAGHWVHADSPESLAETVSEFFLRKT